MSNVEVYVNSEAIKSSVNEAIGVKLVDTSTNWSTQFHLPTLSAGTHPIGDNEQIKISFRITKDTSLNRFNDTLTISIGINGYEQIEFDISDGSVNYNSSQHPFYISNTMNDEGDFIYFEFNFQLWSDMSTREFRQDFRLDWEGAHEVIIKDYVVKYGSSYENTLNYSLDSNVDVLFSSDGYAEDVSELTQNTEDWTRLDLFNDETIQITDSIQDVRDIKKVFTTFSQTFKVPASDANNKVFKHYYNADIDGYDGRFRKDALIKIDGVDYKLGKITLNSASLHNNLVKDYDLTFYGKTLELSDVLGDDTLRNLRGELIQRYNFNFNQSVIKDGFEDGYNHNGTELVKSTDDNYDLCFPFISSSSYYYNDANDNNYTKNNVDSRNTRITQYTGTHPPYGVHYDDLKPALRVIRIIEAIEQEYPITFSDDFFSSSNKPFNDLFLWMQRESGTLSEQIGTNEYKYYVSDFRFAGDDEQRVNYNGSTNLGYLETSSIKVGRNRNYVKKSIVIEATLLDGNGSSTTSANAYAQVFTDRFLLSPTGSVISTETDIQINSNYSFENNSTIDFTVDFDYPTANFVNGTATYVYKPYIKFIADGSVAEIEISDDIIINKIEGTTSSGSSESITQSGTYDTDFLTMTDSVSIISDYFPKIKIIDFLTGLFKMFNLTAYYDGSQVVVKTLDDYYASGSTYDITKYIDTKASKVSKSVIYSDIDFVFEGNETFATSKANELNIDKSRGFGNERLNNSNELFGEPFPFNGGKYEIKVPFEKMMYERMINQSSGVYSFHNWGWAVDSSESPTLCKALLFYTEKVGGSITDVGYHQIFDENVKMQDDTWNTVGGSWDSNNVSLTFGYIRPSNSTDDNSHTLNFGSETDEYTLQLNTNSLFNKFYQTYLTGVYDTKSRIYKFTAHLPSQILNRYELNDIFIIAGREYRINKIKTNLINGKTELELINKL